MVPAIEILVYGMVELSAACKAFPSSILGVKSKDYHGEVLFEIPDPYVSVSGSVPPHILDSEETYQKASASSG